jgi:hypothetical protein
MKMLSSKWYSNVLKESKASYNPCVCAQCVLKKNNELLQSANT